MAEAIRNINEPFGAEEMGVCEVKAHKQIIHRSSSHPLKLPEVK